MDYENGHQPSLPIAVGMIDFDDDWTSDEAKQLIEAGDIPVTLIDGNHTHTVMKEMNEKYPDAECFMTRYVFGKA